MGLIRIGASGMEVFENVYPIRRSLKLSLEKMHKMKINILLTLLLAFLFVGSVSTKALEMPGKNQMIGETRNNTRSASKNADKKLSFLNKNKGVFSEVSSNGEKVTYKWRKTAANKWVPQSIEYANGSIINCEVDGNGTRMTSCEAAAEYALQAAVACGTGDYISCGVYGGLAAYYANKCRKGEMYEVMLEEQMALIGEPKNKIAPKEVFAPLKKTNKNGLKSV